MDILLSHLRHEDSSSELKLLDKRDVKSSYVGANLQSSRTPSAIDSHCRRSYQSARRKLHSSRAKVRFYVAGENNHNAIYAVSPQRFASFDALLGSLTKTPILSKEPEKERYIFSLNGSHKITALNELNSGESYVCATYEVFEQLQETKERPVNSANRYKTLQNAALAAARPTHTSQSSRSRQSGVQDTQQINEEQSEESQFIAELKPRLITVLRGGMRPRRSVRILLSKKSTRSFEQIIAGIGDILCPGEQVKRLFGLSGRLVMCLADFYLDDTVFFAYCQDKMDPEDLHLDKTEVKFVGAYRFRTASAYGRVTLTSHQRGVNNERPKSIPASVLPDVYRLNSESRTGSPAKSSRTSISPPVAHQSEPAQEKHSQEPMEKTEQTLTDNKDLAKSSSQSGSNTSIRTVSPLSDKSKESIHLTPSRSSNIRPHLENKGGNRSYSNSPVHSPSKKRHPSRNSYSPSKENPSSRASRSSFREQPDIPPKSPSKQSHTAETMPSPTKERHLSHSSRKSQSPVRERHQSQLSSQSPVRERHQSQLSSRSPVRERHQLQVSSQSPVRERHQSQVSSQSPVKERHPSQTSTKSSVRECHQSQASAQLPVRERHQSQVSSKSFEEEHHSSQSSQSPSKEQHLSNTSQSSLKERSPSQTSKISSEIPVSRRSSQSSNHSKSSLVAQEQIASKNNSSTPSLNEKTNMENSETKQELKEAETNVPPTISQKQTNKTPSVQESLEKQPESTRESIPSSESKISPKAPSVDDSHNSVKIIEDEQRVEGYENEGQQKSSETEISSHSRTASVTSISSTKQISKAKDIVESEEGVGSNKNEENKQSPKETESEVKEESVVDEDQYSVDFDETANDTDDSQESKEPIEKENKNN